MLAPIIIFAFNRLDALKNTVASLLENEEAKDSELFVFVDGARQGKEDEEEKVKAVQEFVKNIVGFKSVAYSFAETNRGLGASIIVGVTEVIQRYGRVIVIEDDLVLAHNFLSFMNQGLDLYKQEQKVFSVCGYSNKVHVPNDYICDAYFCTRSSSWGWATWADRWMSVDWQLNDWKSVTQRASAFNRWGGSDCYKMLSEWKHGRNQSWAIRFCYSQFVQDKLSLFPILSKVRNNGFDGKGTNCKTWTRFKFDFDKNGNKEFDFPSDITINHKLYKSAKRYNSLCIRIYSKLMYMLH